MAKSSSGGIGIGTILFWGWIIWAFVLDDDDENKEEGTAEKQKPETTIEEKIEVVKDKANEVVEVAKQKFEEVKVELEEEKSKPKPEPESKDPYAYGSDDKYGDYEDKF